MGRSHRNSQWFSTHGASVVDPQPGETWHVLLDPSGHPFYLTKAENWG